jgi:hypothetical protein
VLLFAVSHAPIEAVIAAPYHRQRLRPAPLVEPLRL